MTTQELQRQDRLDTATMLLSKKTDLLESRLGQLTHSQTVYAGRINFTFDCRFCDDAGNITTKKINVSTREW